MTGTTRPMLWKSLWLCLAFLVLSLALPSTARASNFNWNLCVTNPVAFSSPTNQPTMIETGGGTNTDSDGNTCDVFEQGVFPTNNSEDTLFSDFSTTTTNGVAITFHYLQCNFNFGAAPGGGGCMPDGSGSNNTYYTLQLAATAETTDSVTVFMDPTQSGTPSQPVTISLTIDQQAATSTMVTASPNPATAPQVETLTATVTSTSTVNEGTIAFKEDGNAIPGCGTVAVLSNGQATCSISLSAATHSIGAVYSGTANFAASTATNASEVVNPAVAAAQTIPALVLTENINATPGFIPVTGSGGTGTLSYGISPPLPSGLTIGATTGRITGTPGATHATSLFTVTVTDTNLQTASNTFQLTVNAPVATAVAVASEIVTQGHSTPFTPVTATGGTNPITFTIAPTLPAGMSISSSTGQISGASSVTSTQTSYSVTATDTNGSFASSSFDLTVEQAVTATQAVASTGLTQGRAASFTPVTGGGGTGALSYSINPALPSGLSIAIATGAISGTPSVTSVNTTYTVTATDQNSATASNTFTLVVNAAVTAPTGGSPVALTQNHLATPFTPVTSFTGGTTPYTYSINPALPLGLSIDSSSGQISGTPSGTLAATSFTVTATDVNGSSAGNSFSLTINAAVAVSPVSAAVVLTQNQPSLSGLPTVTASGGTGGLTYGIAPTLPSGLSFDTTNGHITGSPSVTHATSSFTVTATDTNGASNSASFSLTVNQAVAASGGTVTANLTQGRAATPFTPVTGSNGTTPYSYSINPALPAGMSISTSTGAVSGTPTATAVATTYTVTVTDTNNATAANTFILTVNAPVTAPTAGVPVAITQGHMVTPFTPVTSFTGGALPYTYSINPAAPTGLTFDTSSGQISGTPGGTLAATSFTVTATDINGSSAGNSFSLTINAAVTATQAIPTEILTQNHLATSFTPVTGAHGTGALTYSISPTLPTGLTLDTGSGAINGTPSLSLAATTFTVTATDTVGANASNTFQLTVNGPVMANVAVASKVLTATQASTSFTPVTGSGGTTPLSYSVSPTLPAGLSLASGTGIITGTPTATQASTNFTVTVTDANNATDNGAFSLTINAATTTSVAIATEALTQNHATNFTPVTAGNGTIPYVYSVSPTLPTGLSIDAGTGAISGSPSGTLAATTFTVTATDANNVAAHSSFSLTINTAVTASQAVASENLTQGRATSGFTPVTGGGGTGTLSYSVAPALPAGLSISSSTGAISGTPSVALAATTFTVTVTDANTATATQTFSLTVNAAPTTTVAIASATLTQGHQVTAFIPVTGNLGSTPYVYSIAPTLPAGLSIASGTGQITGTPTAALSQTNFTVTVTDANGATATGSFSLTVNGPVTATTVIATKGLTVNMAATPFTPVTGSGGTGTLTYSVSPTLPPAMTISSSTGAIGGLPTETIGATTYTVTVTDQNNATSSSTFSLAVNGPVGASTAIPSTTLTQNHASAAFTPATGNGGTTPYSFSVSPALPAGLSLSASTGAITGAPSVTSAAMNYSVTVTDANGATANASFSLTVDPAVTATQAVAMTSIKVHQLATPFIPVTGGGGTGALVYSVSPSLPAGLSLDPATGTISGTPSAVQSATNYTMTVTDTNGATATAGFSIAVTTTVSTVSVTTSANPSSFGQSVTFTAAVTGTGAKPTGTVVFKDGSTTLFTGSLAASLSSYTTSTLAPGVHSISVTYSGDSTFAGSTGTLSQVVGGAASTPGQTFPFKGTLTGFSGPGKGLYDAINDHILICDTANQRIEVLSGQTLAVVATIGVTGVAGSDNAHLNDPTGVALDVATDQIFVADTGNDRIQVFDAATFAYVETIGEQLTSDGRLAGVGNVAFNAPGGMYSDVGTGRLYVADTGNQRVQIFDTATLAYVGTLGTSGTSGRDNAHFNAPSDVTVNPAVGEILVADTGNSRIQRFDAKTLAYKGTIGGAGLNVGDSDYLGAPNTVAYDAMSNLVLIADPAEQRVEVFDALSYNYVETLGTTGSAGSSNGQFSGPAGIVIDTVHERVLIGDQLNNRVQMFAIVPTVAFASVLPGSRSVELGQPATIFASLINAGSTTLQGCQVALPVTAPAGLTLSYQPTNPATNALIGVPDTPVSVAGNNGVQSFLVTFQGSQAFSGPGMALDFDCLGIGPATVETGVNTVDLVMSTAPVADVIALAATASNDGIAKIPAGGASAFAVASSNVGASSQIVVSVDTGSASLPLTATLCQSNPSTGACLATPSSTVTLTDTAGAAPTFSVFLQANGTIPFAPAASRVFVRFKDQAGGIHGSTSVAVETN